eukprot:scaffold53_cov381-Pavlova_lutheri.AAC.13
MESCQLVLSGSLQGDLKDDKNGQHISSHPSGFMNTLTYPFLVKSCDALRTSRGQNRTFRSIVATWGPGYLPAE